MDDGAVFCAKCGNKISTDESAKQTLSSLIENSGIAPEGQQEEINVLSADKSSNSEHTAHQSQIITENTPVNSKNAVVFILAIILAIGGFAWLTTRGGNKPLNENKIAQIVPNDILKYTLNGTTNTMTVNNVSIDKRQTYEKNDIVYAVINMEDRYVNRTAYYIFTINYYDKGGWMIEKWEKYRDSTSYPLSPPSENTANNEISKQYKSYTLNSVVTHDLINGKCAYVYDISDAKRYATFSGQAEVVFSLNSGDDLQWSSSVRASGLTVKWDISGKYTARVRADEYVTAEATVNVIKVTDAIFRLNGNLYIEGTRPTGRHKMNYTLNEGELDYDNEKQQLSATYEAGRVDNKNRECGFTFNADEARLTCYESIGYGFRRDGRYAVMSRAEN